MTAFHVSPGGPALAFDISPTVRCEKRSVSDYDNNSYLILSATGDAVLVDAPANPQLILDWIGDRRVSTVITTHAHPDHVQALATVVATLGAAAVCGAPDADAIERATGVPQRRVWTGDTIVCGNTALPVLGLVGHTPGSIAVVIDGEPAHVLVGDALFPGGVGKTASVADFNSLLGDVQRQLFDRYPDSTVVHPGHGDSTTLGVERPALPVWRQRGW